MLTDQEAVAPGSSRQIVPHPYAYDAHGPGRHQFSVLCWRGWCDNTYRDREIGAMVRLVSGVDSGAPPTGLPARQCPQPDTCDCECHEDPNARDPG
jgi:hypothetical protein